MAEDLIVADPQPLDFPLLADENIAPDVVSGLRSRGHDVRSVWDEAPVGRPDTEVLETATRLERVVGIVSLRQGHVSAAFVLSVLLVGLAVRETAGQGAVPPVSMVVPRHTCAAPSMIRRLVQAWRMPAGVEFKPGPCVPTPPSAAREVLVAGREAADVLNEIVALDGQYAWRELQGVIVVRPAAAWSDPDSLLHTPVAASVYEELNLSRALAVMKSIFAPEASGDVPLAARVDASRRFPATVDDGVALDAFDAIVRGHGALRWEVEYCGATASLDTMRLSLTTYDGQGVGVTAARRAAAGAANLSGCPQDGLR